MTKILYLAHNFEQRKRIRKWELQVEGKYNINLDNPFYDNKQRTDMIKLDDMVEDSKEQREYFKKRDTTNLVEQDLEKIRKSDGLVAIANSVRIGTPMEIFYAARILRIPVYIITIKYPYHPWIKKHATEIFESRIKFEEFVKKEFGLRHGL